VILACHRTRRRVAVISNNSQAAVERYLAAPRLAAHVDVTVGRTQPDPALLKPHPHLILRRARRTWKRPGHLRSRRRLHLRYRGRPRSRHGEHRLRQQAGQGRAAQGAGADAIVTSMAELHGTLLALQPSS
jgi:hypothetical protein